jgi:hypothetical protein
MNRATISDTGLRLSQQKRGPHRSATPKDLQMNNITSLEAAKDHYAFVTQGLVRWTPAQANKVFTDLRYEFNRDEKKAKQHISALARMMRSGAWRSGGAIEFARTPDGKLTLVDGHHRMLAQVEAAVNVVWNVLIHEVPDEKALASLFWTYDTTLRKRSMSNVLAGVSAAESMGLTATMARVTASAAVVIDNGMRPNNGSATRAYTPEETLSLAAEWATEAALYDECVNLAPHQIRGKLRSAQIAAAAFVTFRADTMVATSFWTGIARDDGLRKGDPRKTLLEWMRDTHLAGSGPSSAAVAVARAWNAYRVNETINFIRVGSQVVRFAGSNVTVRP